MMNARIAKEIVIHIPGMTGALASVARILADKGIDVAAVSTWIDAGQTFLRVITEDNLRFVDEIQARGFNMRETEVVLADVPRQVGLLRVISERLMAQDIGITHLYATALSDHPRCVLVLATTNNERTVVLLNERLYEPFRTESRPARHVFA